MQNEKSSPKDCETYLSPLLPTLRTSLGHHWDHHHCHKTCRHGALTAKFGFCYNAHHSHEDDVLEEDTTDNNCGQGRDCEGKGL